MNNAVNPAYQDYTNYFNETRVHSAKIIYVFLILGLTSSPVFSQYKPHEHKTITTGVLAVHKPGCLDKAGTTYMLTNDISSPRSTIFLGKDITFDLNGFTISFADGNYEHIPNSGFEEGLQQWDISQAPGAKIENTEDVHVFIGKKLMSLQKGDIIKSQYINLSIESRSYFAMCGVTGRFFKDMEGDLNNMVVSIYVEDGSGHDIRCLTRYRDTTLLSCPVENKSPRMGGGFVYAHLSNMPAGKYRIRIKAETDCLVDEIDIRPAMDVGIGIVDKTDPLGHYDQLYNLAHCAFFDYTESPSESRPVSGIPEVEGEGSIIIKNGIIKSSTPGILSWGIQSTADNVKIILDNVKIISSGINVSAVDVPFATIVNCTFELDDPFVINRHGAQYYSVDLRGDRASDVSFSDFYGGQGCLMIKGNNSTVHHNYFKNRQAVTNHYSIMAMGDGSKIFENRIEPETGSGIEIYVHKNIEIFNNIFRIETSPPTCEYGMEEYSTAAIRIADYNAKPGSGNGCSGNKVFNNRIYISGKEFPVPENYIPMVWAIYYSASGGDNFIFGNEITAQDLNPESKTETAAFYIGGGAIGGSFYSNLITTNVPAAWIASRYGSAKDTRISGNKIIRSSVAKNEFKPFRIGWMEGRDCVAENIRFGSNEFEGMDFGVDITDQAHSYSLYWTLTINIADKKGNPVPNADIQIFNKNNNSALHQQANEKGTLSIELIEYSVENNKKIISSPYTVIVNGTNHKVELNKNKVITIRTI